MKKNSVKNFNLDLLQKLIVSIYALMTASLMGAFLVRVSLCRGGYYWWHCCGYKFFENNFQLKCLMY